MAKMPTVFVGHGSPTIAIEDNALTHEMSRVGEAVIAEHGKPHAILAVSAHWFTHGTLTQSAPRPEQIYDMYGFPRELYELKYPVSGSRELTEAVTSLLGSDVAINNDWGIDHGSWSVLVHMFPQADIPVVQLSVNGDLTSQQHYELGKRLAPLRDEGFLILGSGNVVHNLGMVDWKNQEGTPEADEFDSRVRDAILRGDFQSVLNYREGPFANYAVPFPDHYFPLIYPLAAGEGETVGVFNNVGTLGSISMTGYTFGL